MNPSLLVEVQLQCFIYIYRSLDKGEQLVPCPNLFTSDEYETGWTPELCFY
jgi:hypothetical protein